MKRYENVSREDLLRRIDELEEFVTHCAGYKGDGSACAATYRDIVADIGEAARELLK